ncbi:hypothetical protein JCM8547_002192 [Rhodosporidiobolus lusitaniae]
MPKSVYQGYRGMLMDPSSTAKQQETAHCEMARIEEGQFLENEDGKLKETRRFKPYKRLSPPPPEPLAVVRRSPTPKPLPTPRQQQNPATLLPQLHNYLSSLSSSSSSSSSLAPVSLRPHQLPSLLPPPSFLNLPHDQLHPRPPTLQQRSKRREKRDGRIHTTTRYEARHPLLGEEPLRMEVSEVRKGRNVWRRGDEGA